MRATWFQRSILIFGSTYTGSAPGSSSWNPPNNPDMDKVEPVQRSKLGRCSLTKVKSFTCNAFKTNCFVAHSGGEAVLVDASSIIPSEHAEIEQYIQRQNLEVVELLLTHAHLDHLYGCQHFEQIYGLPWRVHAEAAPMLLQVPVQSELFGAPRVSCPRFEATLNEDAVVCFGSATWKILHAPGHAPGSVCFVDDESSLAIVGDVLFQNSIGRTDLMGGSFELLMHSIHTKLMTLPDATTVYCGHGPPTTIGHERRHNPFIQ